MVIVKGDDEAKPDLILTNGRGIYFNLDKLTLREWRGLFDKNQNQNEEDRIIAKVCGISIDEYLDISQPDWRRLVDAFLKKAREPLENPS